jgi:hypothetical protein
MHLSLLNHKYVARLFDSKVYVMFFSYWKGPVQFLAYTKSLIEAYSSVGRLAGDIPATQPHLLTPRDIADLAKSTMLKQ